MKITNRPQGNFNPIQVPENDQVKGNSPSDHLRPLDLNKDGNVTVKEAEQGIWRAGFTTIDSKLVAKLAISAVGSSQGHSSHVSLSELDAGAGFHGSSAKTIQKLENLDKIFKGAPYVTEKEIIEGIHERLRAPEGDKAAGFEMNEVKDLFGAYGEWHFLFRAKGTTVEGSDEKVLTYETAKDMVMGKGFEPIRENKKATEGIFGSAIDGINALREGSDLLPTLGKAFLGAVTLGGEEVGEAAKDALRSLKRLTPADYNT